MEDAARRADRHTGAMRNIQPAWARRRPDPASTWAALYPDGTARCIGYWEACALPWVTWNTGLENVRLYACSTCRADERALWRDAQLGKGRLRILQALSGH